MTDIATLLERVRAATGPDRRLDVAMHVAITNQGRLGDYASVDEYTKTAIQLGWNTPRVTASVDAILALIERELPCNSTRFVIDPSGCSAKITYWPEGLSGGKRVQSDEAQITPALALCAAFLSAKAAK